MKLAFMFEAAEDVRVVRYDADEDAGGKVFAVCEDLTSDEIYVSRDSELLLVAFHLGVPIGCVWGKVSVYDDDEDYGHVFSVDVVVRHGQRGVLAGLKLGRAVIRMYFDLKEQYGGDLFMGCEVVNPKLAELLQRRFGFQHLDARGNWGEGEWSVSSPFLVFDGSQLSSRG